ncbi:MAG: HAD-IIB family hydrolase, partial [Clostridia bacterium]
HAFQSMEELRPWMHNISVSLREEDNLRIVCGKAASTRLAETGCMKILAYTDELSRLRRVRPLIEAFPTVDVVSSGDSNIEIMPTGVSKGSALEALAVRMGIEREEIMAFGDHENDHAMLSFAGQSVAMGNALPAIKEICRYVTETNVQGGVGKAVQRWALT